MISQKSWLDAFKAYFQPRVMVMLFLGFSAGIPLLLVFSTLSAWLRDVGLDKTTIGFFSWVGITFSIKVFWAPVVDTIKLPMLTKLLGQRRSWMLLSQIGIAAGLLSMAFYNPLDNLSVFALLAVFVAFCAATQDINIDAYRIEATDDDSLQALMAANYVAGYRVAMLCAGGMTFYLAEYFSWGVSYGAMAALMSVGVMTTLLINEPVNRIEPSESPALPRLDSMRAWLIRSVIEPFTEFFRRNGQFALIILLFISVFRISDITMGVMANPFYLDVGYTKLEIANVVKFFGFGMTIFGSMLGGILVVRFGVLKILLLGAISVVATNLLFSWMAGQEPTVTLLAIVISADNLAGGISNVVFIAYLSSMTSRAYTATQYALFSSLMTFPGKFIGGFSGVVVDQLGYEFFFTYAAAIGIPAIILVIYLMLAARAGRFNATE